MEIDTFGAGGRVGGEYKRQGPGLQGEGKSPNRSLPNLSEKAKGYKDPGWNPSEKQTVWKQRTTPQREAKPRRDGGWGLAMGAGPTRGCQGQPPRTAR